MRLEFRADEGGFYTPDDPMTFCLLCGVSGQDQDGLEHHLTLQRGIEDEDPKDDWGVHFCFDDQINGRVACPRPSWAVGSRGRSAITHEPQAIF